MEEADIFSYKGIPVHYKRTGEGRPLVVLHGWGSSSRVMMPVAEHLKSLRTSYVLDLPGFGDTPEPPEAWGIDEYADMVEAFIRNTFESRVDLLVHSFGGRITLKLCSRSSGPELIEKVLITGGAGMKPKRHLSYYIKKYTAKTMKAPFLILPGKLRERALNWLRSTDAWKRLGSGDYSKLSGTMRGTFVRSVNEHLESTLEKIPHDILLLWGRNDESTPVYQARRMEQGLKKSALVIIEDAGHYAFLDKPKQFAAIAKAYFKG